MGISTICISTTRSKTRKRVGMLSVLGLTAALSACGGGNVRGSAAASVGDGGFDHFNHYHGYGYPNHDHVGAGPYGHNHNHSGYQHYGHNHGGGYQYHDHPRGTTSGSNASPSNVEAHGEAPTVRKPKTNVDLDTGINLGL